MSKIEVEEINDFNSTCMRDIKNQSILKQLKNSSNIKKKKFDYIKINISNEVLSEMNNLQLKLSKKKKIKMYTKIINDVLNLAILSIVMLFMSFTALRLLPEPFNIILAAGFVCPIGYNVIRYIRIYKKLR